MADQMTQTTILPPFLLPATCQTSNPLYQTGRPVRKSPTQRKPGDCPYTYAPSPSPFAKRAVIVDDEPGVLDSLLTDKPRRTITAPTPVQTLTATLHIIAVHPNWSRTWGKNLGYALQDVDGQAFTRVRFEDDGAALLGAKLGAPLVGDYDSRTVDWKVTYQHTTGPNPTLKILSVEDYPVTTPGIPFTDDDAPARRNLAEAERARTNAAAKPTATPALDAVFGPKEQPLDASVSPDEKPECAPWVLDPVARGKFMAAWSKAYNERIAKANAPEKGAEEYRHKWLKAHTGNETLLSWNGGDAETLLASMVKSLDIDYPLPKEETNSGAPDAKQGHSPETGKDASTNQPVAKSEPQSGAETSKDKQVDKTTGEIDLKAQTRDRYTIKRNGKDYLEVQGRVLLFRLEHPDWTIETEAIVMTDIAAVFKATVRNQDGRVIASGHGRATEKGTSNLGGRFVEKGETAAIGRALALAGFGSDDTLDDSDYLSDSPVSKAA